MTYNPLDSVSVANGSNARGQQRKRFFRHGTSFASTLNLIDIALVLVINAGKKKNHHYYYYSLKRTSLK